MILLHRERYKVSEYHRKSSETADLGISEGLVVTVDVHFENWLGGRCFPAEVFIDPGADCTIISLRWIEKHALEADRPGDRTPNIDPCTKIIENTIIRMDEKDLEIPRNILGPRLGKQGPLPTGHHLTRDQLNNLWSMPGYEDILIGRDFLTRHRIMLLVDGEDRKFSMLYPIDSDNRRRRKIILGALDPDEPLVKAAR